MRTAEFEKAILDLGGDIVIDEMKLAHSDVRQVNGHTGSLFIIWDEHGRGFSANKTGSKQIFFTEDEDGIPVEMCGVPVNRDSTFDLKFE
jgi:putative 3-mercaptopyruvate sulfurtransferase